MQVERFELHPVRLPLRAPFSHARYRRRESHAIIVVLRCQTGLAGFGEILPRDYVTGETVESVLTTLGPAMGARFTGRHFDDRTSVVTHLHRELDHAGRHLATFCGFETALLDLAGHAFGFALGKVLGRKAGPPLPAGTVIGFDVTTEALPRHAAVMRLRHTRHVKMKVGLVDDVERLTIVAEALGAPLRIDANAAWESAAEAVRRLRSMRAIPLASVEQPLAPYDFVGARRIRQETGIPVVADEGLCTGEDADRLIEERAADIFNIRLAKCGGLLGALRLVERAQANGLRCHLGTMVGESGILTRLAELFGRFVHGFDWLDGKGQNAWLLANDVLEEPHAAVHAPISASGLGVRVSRDRISRFTMLGENHGPTR
ncbi:mandelate racemase/muconate lactonizing enzyme family protein [Bradyrhizobium sp. CCBAU 051011]|uniref:mandelate racemase/muconate lactonizing enzyme family protein n=1 Tax=Bradyrhizobium sp. CCBAU 051011 TaxID=858422 RepID=UPI00137A135D|nr:enolase C-terminal domain-like protein [Bradyrhizobium sp. CCBAU 051011]